MEDIIALIENSRFPILGIVAIALIKTELINLIKGIGFRMDKSFNEDDKIILNGRKARIVKIGLFKSKFYMYDNNTMRKINNYDIDRLIMEKPLGD